MVNATMQRTIGAHRLRERARRCSRRWRSRVFVNLSESKPRTVELRGEFAATLAGFDTTAVCRLEPQETNPVTALRRGRILREENGTYLLR